jgi:hypothetical protein
MKASIKKDKWRLNTAALEQQHNQFRKACSPLFDKNIQYHNRHTSVTNHHKRATDFGMNGEPIALHDNHDYRTALYWYIARLYEEVEIICRYPAELIIFCEQMVIFSISQIICRPWQFLRYLAAIFAWMQLLGRTQLREQLKAYRKREFNLPDSNTIETSWKTICSNLQHRGQKPTVAKIMGSALQRFLNLRGDGDDTGVVSARRK